MLIFNIFMCAIVLSIGVSLGTWLIDFTQVADLKNENARLKASVDRLEDLVSLREKQLEESKSEIHELDALNAYYEGVCN